MKRYKGKSNTFNCTRFWVEKLWVILIFLKIALFRNAKSKYQLLEEQWKEFTTYLLFVPESRGIHSKDIIKDVRMYGGAKVFTKGL